MAIGIYLDSPFVSVSEYARRTGQTEASVKTDMDRGHIPFFQRHRGAKRLVNMVALTQLAASHANEADEWNDPAAIAKLQEH